MTAISLGKATSGHTAAAGQTRVGLRMAVALVPAAILVSIWGDFARSVLISDQVQPSVEAAALTAASGQRGQAAAAPELAALLNARGDLANVQVGVTGHPDRSVTVNVKADVPSKFMPRLVPVFGIEQSATSPGRVSFD